MTGSLRRARRLLGSEEDTKRRAGRDRNVRYRRFAATAVHRGRSRRERSTDVVHDGHPHALRDIESSSEMSPRPRSTSVPSAFEGLDSLDVGGSHGECSHGYGESVVSGEHAGFESDGEREVQRVVHGTAGDVRELVRVHGQHTAWNRLHGNAADVIDELAAVFSGQLTATDLLPNRVGSLRKE